MKIASAGIASTLVLALLTLPCLAQTTNQELRTRQYLVGRWNCTFTVGGREGSYTTVWANALDNRWLTQSIIQPASRGKAREITDQGFRSKYFVGYDDEKRQWVRFGAMTTGQYFAIRMRDLPNGSWGWRYISFFASNRATRKDDAQFLKQSDSRYIINGPTYPSPSGTLETEHHICTKVS